MSSCTLYVVRHGQSEANRDHITCGQLDSPLTELGIQQANETKELLAGVHFSTTYSSDLQRASRTAEIIFDSPIPDDHILPALRERTFGKLEGQSDTIWKGIYKQFEQQYGDLPLTEKWQLHYAPYIESNQQLSERFLGAIREIGQKHLGETVLIGAHSGCIRTTLLRLGFSTEKQLPPDSFANSAYIVLSFDEGKLTIEKVTGVTPVSD